MTVPHDRNMLPIHRKFFDDAADPARVFGVFDSQGGGSLGRLFSVMVKDWKRRIDWAGLPLLPGMQAPFSIGFSSDPGPSGVIETTVLPAATYAVGDTGRFIGGVEFTIASIADADIIFDSKMNISSSHMVGLLDGVEIEARMVYEDNHIASVGAEVIRGGTTSGRTIVTPGGGGGYALYKGRVVPSGNPNVQVIVTANGPTVAQTIIVHGGLWLEVSGGQIVRDRPIHMGETSLGGSKLTDWAGESLNSVPGVFDWNNLGLYLDKATDGDKTMWPNVIMPPGCHNDGAAGVTASALRAGFESFRAKIDAVYSGFGVPFFPKYWWNQNWCVGTIDNDYWHRLWLDAFLPVASGDVGVSSIAARQGFRTWDGADRPINYLDVGALHPVDQRAGDFFFDEALFSMLVEPSEKRFPFGAGGPDVPGTGDPRTGGFAPGGNRPLIPGTGTLRPRTPVV